MYHRNITKQIESDLQNFPIIGIVGPRQVGKTTLAKYLQKNLEQKTLYLDLELDTDRNSLDDPEMFLKFHSDKSIIIDEIQRLPSLFPLLRALVDIDRKPARFIILGSASPSLIKHSSETLAGRIAYSELTPFSMSELPVSISMNAHWIRGGFPEALFSRSVTHTRRWLNNFIETFIYRDLQDLGHKLSPKNISRLLGMLSTLNGNILNLSNLARSMGVTHPTINHYLDILEGGFIIHRLQPYSVKIRKRLIKTPKVYIRDSGILHALVNISSYNQLVGNPIIGASWESYVIEQIKRELYDGWKFYFYRTHKGAESDLVLISPYGRIICIEIKLSSSPKLSRGFYESIKDIKPDYSFIITPEGGSVPKGEDTILCGIKEFFDTHLNEIKKEGPNS